MNPSLNTSVKTIVSFVPEAELAIKLLSLLESEQSALTSFQVDTMETLLEEKFLLLNNLSHYSQQRYQALAANGFEANESGMKNWLTQNNNAQVDSAWQAFQNTLTRSKEANRVNGVLVTKQFNRNQQMLTALQGPNSSAKFYGPNGQTANASSLRNGIVA